ncbi:glycosyltransferase [Pedobacter glucosidilyticus]|uniref:glycosyltransferase n=1 Tax=Pedobacter glucosidilyticus TaxID=1122941 RepID=UPI0026F0487E|nr:glycosyltransferase [Pedobacter glucosidilyticus]
MKIVYILSQSHLCRNPRVVKEALLLLEMGFEVKILTCKYNEELHLEDLKLVPKEITIEHFADLSKNNFKTLYLKVIRRLAIIILKKLRIETPYVLGYGFDSLLSKARTKKAHWYICHQEIATLVGKKLLEDGSEVAFDLEDWYSEDLLESARKERPIRLLQQAEETALKKGLFCTTTSHVMADAMAKNYGARKPFVVYNSFEKQKNIIAPIHTERKDFTTPSLTWFSQTIGPGRGLELLMDALGEIKEPLQIHLRGNITVAYRAELLNRLKSNTHLIYFHKLVSPNELPACLAVHDIGLALELSNPKSRNLTITNKIMQYAQAGLAIVASHTAGQEELALQNPKGIKVFNQDNVQTLIKIIRDLIADREKLSLVKAASLEFFHTHLCWELEKEKYKNLLLRAFKN